jgi:hypothetical protein
MWLTYLAIFAMLLLVLCVGYWLVCVLQPEPFLKMLQEMDEFFRNPIDR